MFYMIPKVIFDDYYNESYNKKINKEDNTRLTQLNELILIPYLYSIRYKCNITNISVASTNLLLNWAKLDLHNRKVNKISEAINTLNKYDWFMVDLSNHSDKNSIIKMDNNYSPEGKFGVLGYDELDVIFDKMSTTGNLNLLNVYCVLKFGCNNTFIKDKEDKDKIIGVSFSTSDTKYKQISALTGIKKSDVIKRAIDELEECGVVKIKKTKKEVYKYHEYSFKEIKKSN